MLISFWTEIKIFSGWLNFWYVFVSNPSLQTKFDFSFSSICSFSNTCALNWSCCFTKYHWKTTSNLNSSIVISSMFFNEWLIIFNSSWGSNYKEFMEFDDNGIWNVFSCYQSCYQIWWPLIHRLAKTFQRLQCCQILFIVFKTTNLFGAISPAIKIPSFSSTSNSV